MSAVQGNFVARTSFDLCILIDTAAGGCLAYDKLLHQYDDALSFHGHTLIFSELS